MPRCKCRHCPVHDTGPAECCGVHEVLHRLDAIDAALVKINKQTDDVEARLALVLSNQKAADAKLDHLLDNDKQILLKLDTALAGIDAILEEVEEIEEDVTAAQHLHLTPVATPVPKLAAPLKLSLGLGPVPK